MTQGNAISGVDAALALSTLERAARVGIWTYDVASDTVRWSNGTYNISGRSPDGFTPTVASVLAMYAPDSQALLEDAIRQLLEDGADLNLELELLRPDGSSLWLQLVGEAQTEGGRVVGATGCVIDVDARRSAQSERRRLIEHVHYQQQHDQLTGLPNRHKLESTVAVQLAQAQNCGISGWLLHLDLTRFKLVNEACGYAAGDRLILELVPRLQRALQPWALLARFGGDKFGVLLPALTPAAVMSQAEALIAAVTAYRFESGDHSLTVGLAVGATPLDANTGDVSTVLRQAETSCQVAKLRGGDRVILYHREDSQLANAEEDQHWGEQILLALDEGRFELHAQRIVNLDGGDPSYEILLRMRQRDGLLVLPGRFLPAARRYGLMTTLDRRVLALALAQFRAGAFDRHPCAYVSINLSAPSLSDEAFINFLLPMLSESCINPDRLRFEITESEAMHNVEHAQRAVTQLRTLGFRVMLDDFGSGYASFAYLRSLKVDGLKIDNSCTRALDRDPFNQAVVASIAGLCGQLDLELVAEGVEDEATLAVLRRLKVRYAQGWLFHRPQPLQQALLGDRPSAAGITA